MTQQTSVLNQVWEWAPKTGNIQGWAQQLGLSQIVGQVLSGRNVGIDSASALADFLSPSLKQLPDPDLLPDVTPAAKLLAQTITTDQQIAIFGDYDVDGSCATAVLQRYLRALGVEPFFYIPDRMTEGYGPTPAAMEKIKAKGAHLLLTVDCGSVAFEALAKAAELGLQVVVTDHHQMQATQPPAAALINPHRLDAPEEFRHLSGAGVAFYLVLGLNRLLREQGYFTDERPEPDVRLLLDLVALSTVADVMPLMGVNRIFVSSGLKLLARTRNEGLKALLAVAGAADKPVSAHTLGFVLGPRINAGGRVGSSNLAVDILTSTSPGQAQNLAQELDDLNQERRSLEQQTLAEAVAKIEALPEAPPVIIVADSRWHPGVVGIVAARLKERFYRPSFVLGGDDLGQLKGSARSISGIDVGKAMQSCRDVVLSGGGHAMAAGVTLLADQLEAFKEAFTAAVLKQVSDDAIWQPKLRLDAQLGIGAATPELVHELNALAPFGAQNPQPRVVFSGVRCTYSRAVGQDESHLKVSFEDRSGQRLEGIAFKAQTNALGPFLQQHKGLMSVAGTLEINIWRGQQSVQLVVADAWAEAWQPGA